MQVPIYLGVLRASEQQLAAAFDLIGERHVHEAEVRDTSRILAGWSRDHIEALEPVAERFGAVKNTHPGRVRRVLFQGPRIGGLGLLQDLQDLSLLANQTRTTWTALQQAFAELHDAELEEFCKVHGRETDRQVDWLCTQIKQVAPQALVVPVNLVSDVRASLPQRPSVLLSFMPPWVPWAAGGMLGTGILALAARRLSAARQ